MLLGLVVETAPEAADRCGVLGPAEGGGRQAPASAPPALTGSELSARLAQRPGFAPTRNNYTPAPPGRHFDPRYLITVADAPVPSGSTGQPQYRSQGSQAHLSFGACLGATGFMSAPAALGCMAFGGYCASALFGNESGAIACRPAVGFCSVAGAIGLSCWVGSRGGTLQGISPELGNFPPSY